MRVEKNSKHLHIEFIVTSHNSVCHNIRDRKSGNNPVVTLLRKYKSSTNVKHTLAKQV